VHRLAHALAEGAEAEGAEVRLRHVEELASELIISQNQYWGRHRSEVEDEPVASLEDLEWAEGVAFGIPTRFGNVAAQLKQFMDPGRTALAGGQARRQGGDRLHRFDDDARGQESTILALNNTLYHWGMLILPLGYTASEVFNAGGNPYGTSYTSGKRVEGPSGRTLAVAHYQGQRLARYAAVVAAAREADAFRLKRPRPERFQAATLD
jgi:NAD(P)H dehydrogenase (quinone)